MSSHSKRLLTASFLLPLTCWILWQRGRILDCGLALIATLGLHEFLRLFPADDANSRLNPVVLAAAALSFFLPLASDPAGLFYLLLIVFWGLALYFLARYSRFPHQTNLVFLFIPVAGFLYIPCTLHLLRWLTPLETYVLLACVFASDAGAYYSGALWGNKKIWPGISPKKTWAGSLGGFGLCLFVALIAGFFWGQAPMWTFVFLGAAVNISAQLGDFFASGLKRWARVKDSGQLLPGHGGLLDRMDSILFALPVYFALTLYWHFFR